MHVFIKEFFLYNAEIRFLNKNRGNIILQIFIILSVLQISYWIFFLVQISSITARKIAESSPEHPCSIIICFKNERENIKRNLESWLANVNAKDELILVDDFSNDGSSEYLESKIGSLSNVKIINSSKDIPGKK